MPNGAVDILFVEVHNLFKLIVVNHIEFRKLFSNFIQPFLLNWINYLYLAQLSSFELFRYVKYLFHLNVKFILIKSILKIFWLLYCMIHRNRSARFRIKTLISHLLFTFLNDLIVLIYDAFINFAHAVRPSSDQQFFRKGSSRCNLFSYLTLILLFFLCFL